MGKSFMLQVLGQYARHHGLLPIAIGPEHLTSVQLLHERVEEHLSFDPVVVRRRTSSGSYGAELVVPGARLKGGGQTTEEVSPVVSFDSVINRAAQVNPPGVVFLLDECQMLDGYVTPVHRESIQSMLRHFHARTADFSYRPPVHLICAGLPNCTQVMSQFGITQYDEHHVVSLLSLSEEAGTEIIGDFLDLDLERGTEMSPIPPEWNHQLVERYHASPFQIAAAGILLQGVALDPSAVPISGDSRLIQDKVDAKQRSVYEYRTQPLNFEQRYCLLALGQAAQYLSNRFPEEVTVEIIDAAHRKYRMVRQPEAQASSEAIHNALVQAGLLERHAADEDYPTLVRNDKTESYEELTMHGLEGWLESKRLKLVKAEQSGNRKGVLSYEFREEIENVLGGENGVQVPSPWQFDRLAPVPDLPALPDIPEELNIGDEQGLILPYNDSFGRPMFLYPEGGDDDNDNQ